MKNAYKDIKSLTADELKEWLSAHCEKAYRADQIENWLFCQQVSSYDQMKNIPQQTRDKLAQSFAIRSLTEVQHLISVDGTVKWLFQTPDEKFIETVLIPTNGRYSVCVSTQIGCAQNCAFCRTAKMGFIRNLEAGEILEEIIRVNEYLKETGEIDADGKPAQVTNIIFMGMGEPLNNLENVHRTCCTLHNQKLFNLGRKKMTISTSGVVPKIKELVDRNTPCCLAVSLNSTNNERRSSVMPVNKVWPIEKLLEATDEYTRRTDNYVTFEFVLMKGVTCTDEAAKELIKICAPRRCKVNAIVLNQMDDPNLEAPTQEEVDRFLEKVRAAQIQITIRNPRGRDILAACGQLAYKKQQKVANVDTESA
ncbi:MULTISPECIES: 23S rRNA (adenine(2503)-C(2))-methyltransferase RlmN [Fibrobacter]|uniref:Probable dual-specificity RNA methyltransferase RlmN n=1 Tax=Fibrobacter intestinalis TaxID=28122 RepID=A0A1M6TIU9_9BACT|nr:MULTISPECIES: 23S rRNA (adenine(2503)-C(2))-methyltransferase RlmN [Fibrobacter]MDD7297848.1 23S rRNA (adenine(2503)-C(2))-methyltransferase RlmN [Fibrobacter intestinalis]PBC68280.1 23S rRNA m(2)A-2503 methyltransferase [Fibrobacter sp. UWS1]PBC73578.1 23S rRNA m(2)A-2503 methyltransferase [Fibrobacter sp. NR9]SHK56891.1 23S rRNA m(2)A-2503 methyltransferase [Fibrobacter intestinalis]SJZ63321.1 23S rRNA m(2)A-2503 methyltransferase [Fibrobacter intestinalis]